MSTIETPAALAASDAAIDESSCKASTPAHIPTEDATNIKFVKAKTRSSGKTTVSSLMAVAAAIFAIDFLLLGRTGEARTGWFTEASQLWEFITKEAFAFDACYIVLLLALISFQLGRHTLFKNGGSAKDKQNNAKRASLSKGQQPKHPRAGSGDVPGGKAGVRPPDRPMAPVAKWNQAIDLAARQGDVKKAGQLLLEFERQGEGKGPGNRPDTVSYNLVIRACAKKGDIKGAENWLKRMKTNGVEATVCSYNTVLDACAKADNAEACEALLEKMLERGDCKANVISYATAIYAWARRGEEGRAEFWLNQMMGVGIEPDAVSYNSMIHACGVGGKPARAEHWLAEMLAKGLEASVTTFTAVIDACAKGGDVKRAENVLEQMIAAGVQPNVVSFSAMIDACAKACDPVQAEFWHDRMIQCNIKPNAHSFSAVINACAKVGDVARAEQWLGRSEEAGITNDVVVYSSVIDACGKAGDAERASIIFKRMQDHGIRPHIVAYAALARPYAYHGDYVEVERIAKEMAESGIAPNEYFLYAQLLSYATTRPRQAQRAEACFRQANAAGLKANDHVVGALVRATGRDRCTELMQELCNGRSVPLPPPRRGDRDGGKGAR